MTIKICVGSSCHLKGSYEVIEGFKRVISRLGVEDKVDLQASFCLGKCSSGVTIKADERYICDINGDNAEEVFEKEIYPYL